jgi:protein-S-isoprenylcysteine O-methyltransferase Ste14
MLDAPVAPAQPTSPSPKAIGVVDGVLAALRGSLMIGIPLLVPAGLVPAGTWLWLHGLSFVGVHGAISLAGNVALVSRRPDHFRVRQQGVVASRDRQQPLIDAVGAAMLVGFGVAWLIFIPIDVFHLHLLPAPSQSVSIVGGLCAVAGATLGALAVWENRFATPNVQDQTAQGQRVVDTGVYGLIRHPIYAGNLLLFGGATLWLGSTAAFLGVGVLLAATIGRIVVEEAHLRANVPGYEDYARRVRSRLIPFLV